MRAYLGRSGPGGLDCFVPEDLIPDDLLREFLAAWAGPASVVFRAVLAEDDAEAIRRELHENRPDVATARLRDRAVEILPIADAGPGVEDGAGSPIGS